MGPRLLHKQKAHPQEHQLYVIIILKLEGEKMILTVFDAVCLVDKAFVCELRGERGDQVDCAVQQYEGVYSGCLLLASSCPGLRSLQFSLHVLQQLCHQLLWEGNLRGKVWRIEGKCYWRREK